MSSAPVYGSLDPQKVYTHPATSGNQSYAMLQGKVGAAAGATTGGSAAIHHDAAMFGGGPVNVMQSPDRSSTGEVVYSTEPTKAASSDKQQPSVVYSQVAQQRGGGRRLNVYGSLDQQYIAAPLPAASGVQSYAVLQARAGAEAGEVVMYAQAGDGQGANSVYAIPMMASTTDPTTMKVNVAYMGEDEQAVSYAEAVEGVDPRYVNASAV